MAITIQENFEVDAPIERVWQFLLDAQRVVDCMPGAQLDEVIDDRTFLGKIRVKVSAITTNYSGQAHFEEIDDEAYRIVIVASGSETGGGTAKGRMVGELRTLDNGGTQVFAEGTVDIAGRLAQFGRGIIVGISHQLFLDFVRCVKTRLEADEGQTELEPVPGQRDQPIPLFSLVLRTIASAISGFVRRFFRGGSRH